jgi:isoquinoline 1-oxidoreductase subunit beta
VNLKDTIREQGTIDRRNFLRVSAAAASGLMVSLYLDFPASAQDGGQAPPAKIFPPDAFIHIRPDGKIVIQVNRVEVGQGTHTALPLILADELDADWSQVIAELAPAADVYKDPLIGVQWVGGSTAIANSFPQYRELGARARSMLVQTAADRWRVKPEQCRTASSIVYGPGNRSVRYSDLANEAARRPIPDQVALKNPSEFKLIGKPVRRLDGRAKCDGSHKFAIDLDLPAMLIALVARPPVFSGKVRSFDDKEARAVPGVRDVFEYPLVKGSAVAVVADKFWIAKQARDRLKVDWDLEGIEHADSSRLFAQYKELAKTPGGVALKRGDETAIDRIPESQRIVAEFEFPYLAHAPMEPLTLAVRFDGDRAEAWVPAQLPTWEQAATAEVLGLAPEQVKFNVLFAGGSFGRRGLVDSHLVREAAAIAKRVRGRPVKLIFTREDDMRSGYYRPMFAHRVEVGIGSDGAPLAWRQVVVGQSFVKGTGVAMEAMLVKNGVDHLAVEGSSDSPYAVPNVDLTAHHPTVNVPVLSHRSVGYGHNSFVRETLIEELANRAKADPIAYRLKLLNKDAYKFRAVLTLLNEKANWRTQLPAGHAVGYACSAYNNTACACAAEVSIVNGRPRIHRVTVTVHCGLAVNPLTVESQFQGGIGFGLTQVMPRGAITLKEGRVEQGNFDRYMPPYIADAPTDIDVHVVQSTEPPTGVGEAPVPIIAPAVVNALYHLTGKRYRSLPLGEL